MVIIGLMGGLGNQMFQYALYKKLEEKESRLDISYFYLYRNNHNGYELENIFNINPKFATIQEISKYSNYNINLDDGIRYINNNSKHKNEELEFTLNENILNIDEVYLQGYWQSIKYLDGIELDLRRDFSFKNSLEGQNKEILEEIKSTNSISIHIRRGDYMSPDVYKVFGNIATEEYYKKAITIIEENVVNPIYYIFSNDLEWVKQNINIDGQVRYIDINKGKDSYIDMQLMSNCKHNIIANSTFSWWGAWLNNNKNKIVIAPKKWVNTTKNVELFYEEWITI